MSHSRRRLVAVEEVEGLETVTPNCTPHRLTASPHTSAIYAGRLFRFRQRSGLNRHAAGEKGGWQPCLMGYIVEMNLSPPAGGEIFFCSRRVLLTAVMPGKAGRRTSLLGPIVFHTVWGRIGLLRNSVKLDERS